MGWQAALRLDYDLADGRTRGHSEHSGPYRVLKALYPEGDAVCHHVLVHPPSGLVGGDRIGIRMTLAPGSHAVLTTPGATRFYRSLGDEATQSVDAHVAGGARLEWLPLENLVYSGALAVNHQRFQLDDGVRRLAFAVHRHANNTAGYEAFVIFAAGKEGRMRSAITQWYTKALAITHHAIGSPLPRRC